MKINKKYITPLLIAGTILTLTVVGEKADAAVLTGNVDTSWCSYRNCRRDILQYEQLERHVGYLSVGHSNCGI